MNEHICTLCLRTSMNNFPILDVDLQAVLDDLLSTSILNMPQQQNMVCNECLDNLQKLYDFKISYVDILGRTSEVTNWETDASLNLQETGNKQIVKSEHDEKDPTICSYCTKINLNLCFIPLHELKKNTRVVNMMEKHIPKLNINNMENIISCESCHQLLQDIINFITNCFHVEEKIGKYIEILDDKDQIDLNKVQAFVFKPTLQEENEHCNTIKNEDTPDENENPSVIKSEPELECELKIDIGSVTKSEEFDINLEMGVTDGSLYSLRHPRCLWRIVALPTARGHFTLSPTSHSAWYHQVTALIRNTKKTFYEIDDNKKDPKAMYDLIYRTVPPLNMMKCELCTYETSYRNSMRYHMLTHRDPSEIGVYLCNDCEYETMNRSHFNRHCLMHRDPSEIRKYKCEMCAFVTVHRASLTRHMWTHKSSSDKKNRRCALVHQVVRMHKCELCTYETKYKENLKKHGLTHKNSFESKSYKCSSCTFESLHKTYLTRHSLIHKDPSKVTLYKCEVCTFATKHKMSLKRHMLSHKDPREIPKYKCEMCTFETIRRSALQNHMLVHKDPSERQKYKCQDCAYETFCKAYLKQHILTHKDSSWRGKYKCQDCKYETLRKACLNQHILTHKDPSERQKYKCQDCAYETLRKACLKQHILTHKDPSWRGKYKCQDCKYETLHERFLKRHQLCHKEPSEISM